MSQRISWKCILAVYAGVLATAVLIGGLVPQAQQPAAAPLDLPDRVDFNWDIRPILSDNCFSCHGRDESKRMAGLRLDDKASALAERGTPPHHAIVPGDPDASELIKRVTNPDPKRRMPYFTSNKTLTDRQIALLRKWIAQGAEYKPHWAFITPVLPPVPQVSGAPREGNEIDRFILARLQREGLQLSPEADRETLINRVTLTLTGLPPTLAEVDAFVADKSANAYEMLVDRLLASPAYGEHMATYWMDLARYAESDGLLDDLHDRLFWPYRDWVIGAFNKNMPFDQFAKWQLAGDLMPSHTKEQTLATAFVRLGQRTTEAGAIDEEFRAEYTIERANTVGTAFLGLTTGCARCHDHKYDPISQKDFYSLTGFFNSNDEPGYYAKPDTGVTPGPTLPWTSPEDEAALANAQAVILEREATYKSVQDLAARELRTRPAATSADGERVVKDSIAKALVAYLPFEETTPIPDDKLATLGRPGRTRPQPKPLAPETAAAANPYPQPAAPVKPNATPAPPPLPYGLVKDSIAFSPAGAPGQEPAIVESPLLQPGVKGQALFFGDTTRGVVPGVGDFERTEPFSFDLWVYAPTVYNDEVNRVTLFNRALSENGGSVGYKLLLLNNQLEFSLVHTAAGNLIRLITKQPVPVKQWTHVTVTYDGSSKASGTAIYVNGVRAETTVLSDTLTRSILTGGSGGAGGRGESVLAFGRVLQFSPLKEGAIDELRVFKRALQPIEVAYLHAQTRGGTPPTAAAAELEDLLVANDPRVQEAFAKLTAARTEYNDRYSKIPEIMVMGDTPQPRPTYLLIRGLYSEHGPELKPQGLSEVFPWNDAFPRNRLGLVQWLFDPKNPLTARVFVNRVWQRQFGRGLVETAGDFGSQGSIPTHPELLDWLAVTFETSGWDIKALHKRIVMSTTYRQSSRVSDDLLEKDPRNQLLARFTRVRLPAEVVRDNVLASSGLLEKTIGGPSVYPYQPAGIWDGISPKYSYPAADKIPQDEQHRRSLYSFIKRNAPHPASANFDMPNRTVSAASRQTSNSPLQALVLMDDPQYVEAYRMLAQLVLDRARNRDEQVRLVFRLATRREPLGGELAVLTSYYDAEVQRFDRDRSAATALVAIGVTPAKPDLDPVRLAALTDVVAVAMNTPDAYSLR